MSVQRPFERLAFAKIPEAPRLPHAWAASVGRTLTVRSAHFGDLAIHHRVMGEGPPLLLLHGLMTTSYSWRYVIEPLSRHFTVYAPDLPGCGRSDRPADRSFAPDHLAHFIVDYQRAAGIDGCVAIGNSMGGYLCMRAALDHPRAFRRLVNMHSPGIPEPRLYALRALVRVPGVTSLLEAVVRRDPVAFAHRNVHYFDETLKSLEEAREYGSVLADSRGLRCFVRYLSETMNPWPMREFVSRLRTETFPIPLMLLYARRDPMVPARIGTELSALVPSAKMVWLENTSHFAHVDTPQAVLDAVIPFLRD